MKEAMKLWLSTKMEEETDFEIRRAQVVVKLPLGRGVQIVR
jgi:hypothetical protein